MAAAMHFLGLMVLSVMQLSTAQNHSSFVPLCMAEECSAEASALGGDNYTKALGACTVKNFGPCASKAWDCLGDASCRAVLTCAPSILKTCQADIWKMLTEPKEREKIMCLESCIEDGKINPWCVATKCGKAAIECVADPTCLDTALCLPKAQLACSKPALDCIFGQDTACRENLQCLANGVVQCGSPAVNLLTDSKIADFVACAGSKCPHPVAGDEPASAVVPIGVAAASAPTNMPEQLLCMAEKCSTKTLKILEDQDTKDLLTCALKADLPTVCSSVWDCLGNQTCANHLACMNKPFETCGPNMWQMLTIPAERKRLESTARCLRKCENDHKGDFVEASFCVLDSCSQQVLDCYHDSTCREAVKCLPNTIAQCAMPTLDAYAHEELFQKSVKCLGHGLESCGRAAVELLRNQDIVDAVRCGAQCTRTPQLTSSSLIV